jgi:hypothetical protein
MRGSGHAPAVPDLSCSADDPVSEKDKRTCAGGKIIFFHVPQALRSCGLAGFIGGDLTEKSGRGRKYKTINTVMIHYCP